MVKNPDNTRERLLDHGERLFAEKGYDGVSVREITAAADCNLAAVNYYFRGKQRLYMAVFRERWARRSRGIRQGFTQALEGKGQPAVEDIISAVARGFLEGPLNDEERRIHIQLMQRELSDPGQALEMIVEDVMRPYVLEIEAFLRPHLDSGVSEGRLRLNILSILGVALYFFLAHPIVSRIIGREYDEEFKSELVTHITAFSMQGIEGLCKGKVK
ncbi:MAG: TetR/AcrR family transcriptional regulator [Desulfosalsimonas sp.]